MKTPQGQDWKLEDVRRNMWREFSANEGLFSMEDIRKSVEWGDKEFLQRLKEEFKKASEEAMKENEDLPFITLGEMDKIIDKLAGQSLIGDKNDKNN